MIPWPHVDTSTGGGASTWSNVNGGTRGVGASSAPDVAVGIGNPGSGAGAPQCTQVSKAPSKRRNRRTERLDMKNLVANHRPRSCVIRNPRFAILGSFVIETRLRNLCIGARRLHKLRKFRCAFRAGHVARRGGVRQRHMTCTNNAAFVDVMAHAGGGRETHAFDPTGAVVEHSCASSPFPGSYAPGGAHP